MEQQASKQENEEEEEVDFFGAMPKKAKIRLVKDITAQIRDEVISLIQKEKIPDHWDGIEMRQLLADKFSKTVFSGMMPVARKRRYNNTKRVRGL